MDGDYEVAGPKLGEVFELCPGERFAEQPSVATCSAVLIALDRVLVAGHCFGFRTSPRVNCSAQRYVFRYAAREAQQALSVKPPQVYECARVITRVVSPPGADCQWDFAVVELDRPVQPPHAPAVIRTTPLEAGEPLAVIGFTSGLPVKVDLGAHVLDPRLDRADYFTLDSDTFTVSSGSGVFDTAGRNLAQGLSRRGEQSGRAVRAAARRPGADAQGAG